MKYHKWAIRLVDKNGIKRYISSVSQHHVFIFSSLSELTRLYQRRSDAQYYLREDKKNHPLQWRVHQNLGITATVVKVQVTLEEV